MRRFILDTNICLAYIRGHSLCQVVENDLQLESKNMLVLISVATKAELLSLGIQNGWAVKKLQNLERLLKKFYTVDINANDKALLDAYAQIDAFSQGKLPNKPLGMSARNMGKNDLWIAATAFTANAELVTTDGDFDHLNGNWLTVHKYQE